MIRRFIIIFALLAATLVSCNKSESIGTDEFTLTYNLTTPLTKSTLGEGGSVNYVWYALYRADGTLVQEYPLQPFIDGNAVCPVTMVRNQNYNVIFVAQHYKIDGESRTPIYAVDPSDAAVLMPEDAVANSDDYDLFCYMDEVIDYDGSALAKPITLVRKVAQINYFSTDADVEAAETLGMSPTASEIVLTGVPAAYDLLREQVSFNTVEVSYSKADLTGEDNLLATAFCLAGDVIPETELRLYKDNNCTTYFTVDNVPVAPNKRTNITGSFMTGTLDYVISINIESTDKNHPID